jgi:hypothetical protein
VGATLLMVSERGLLVRDEWPGDPAVTLWVLLPVLLVCHWFPYVVSTAALLHVGERLLGAVRGSTGRKRILWTMGLLSAPFGYASLLSFRAFSGPQAQLAWYRPIALVVLPLLVASALVFPLLAARRDGGRRFLRLGALAAVGMVCLVINALVLPDEYEPVHVFLALEALLCCFTGSVGC